MLAAKRDDDAPLLVLRKTRSHRTDTVDRLGHAHPLVRELFRIMAVNQVGVGFMADRSGVARTTFWNWLNRHAPTVPNLEAALNVLGYELSIQPIGRGRPKQNVE